MAKYSRALIQLARAAEGSLDYTDAAEAKLNNSDVVVTTKDIIGDVKANTVVVYGDVVGDIEADNVLVMNDLVETDDYVAELENKINSNFSEHHNNTCPDGWPGFWSNVETR